MKLSCVPKKVTWNAAALAESIGVAKSYGFSLEQTKPFDFTTFKHKRDDYIKRLNGIYEKNLKNDKVEYYHGRAHLLDKHQVEVVLDDGKKEILNAKKILIATGGHPKTPDLPGSEYGIDSDGFFDLETLPKRVVTVGAGYIAVEMAGMLHHLGSEVHMFIRGDTFLRSFDPMVQEVVVKEYERQGIKIHRQAGTFEKVEKSSKDGFLTVHYKDKDGEGKLETDCILWAIGRAPQTKDLGMDKAGIKTGEKGYITVDEYQNTNVDNIYALGDVCGKVELTPVAIAAGRRLAERLFGPEQFRTSKLAYDNVPSTVFAHPEVGTIGMTEPEAIEKFGKENVKIYKTSFTEMYYTFLPPDEKPPTSYKIVCEGPREKVVGLHIIGSAASEILQGFGVAIKMGATKADFDSCVAIHPTSAEEIVTMK